MESKTGPHHPRARGHRFPPTPSPSNDHLEALETGKTRHSSRKQGRLQERAPPSDRGVRSNILLSLKQRLNGLVGGVSGRGGQGMSVSSRSFVAAAARVLRRLRALPGPAPSRRTALAASPRPSCAPRPLPPACCAALS